MNRFMCQKLALTLWIKTIIYFPFLLLFAALIATFRLKLNTVSSFFCDSASSAGAWWYFSGTGTHFVIKGNKKDGSVKKNGCLKNGDVNISSVFYVIPLCYGNLLC